MKPMSIISLTAFALLSIIIPSLLLVSMPLFAFFIFKAMRHAAYVRRSRTFFYEEMTLLRGAKIWKDLP